MPSSSAPTLRGVICSPSSQADSGTDQTGGANMALSDHREKVVRLFGERELLAANRIDPTGGGYPGRAIGADRHGACLVAREPASAMAQAPRVRLRVVACHPKLGGDPETAVAVGGEGARMSVGEPLCHSERANPLGSFVKIHSPCRANRDCPIGERGEGVDIAAQELIGGAKALRGSA